LDIFELVSKEKDGAKERHVIGRQTERSSGDGSSVALGGRRTGEA
jgi:hypothetical protein